MSVISLSSLLGLMSDFLKRKTSLYPRLNSTSSHYLPPPLNFPLTPSLSSPSLSLPSQKSKYHPHTLLTCSQPFSHWTEDVFDILMTFKPCPFADPLVQDCLPHLDHLIPNRAHGVICGSWPCGSFRTTMHVPLL